MTPDIDRKFAEAALKDYIQPDGGLFCLGHYLSWSPGDKNITLDCEFDAEELSAIVWWMQHSQATL